MKTKDLPKEWEEAINHMSSLIKEEIDNQVLLEIYLSFPSLTSEMLQWIADHDNRERELSDREIDLRMMRVNGDIKCEICGKPYYLHDMEMRVIGWQDKPFLHWLCNGILGKL